MANTELPLGFGFALAQNPVAMERFTALSQQEKDAMVAKAHQVSSKQEMRQLVNTLTN